MRLAPARDPAQPPSDGQFAPGLPIVTTYGNIQQTTTSGLARAKSAKVCGLVGPGAMCDSIVVSGPELEHR